MTRLHVPARRTNPSFWSVDTIIHLAPVQDPLRASFMMICLQKMCRPELNRRRLLKRWNSTQGGDQSGQLHGCCDLESGFENALSVKARGKKWRKRWTSPDGLVIPPRRRPSACKMFGDQGTDIDPDLRPSREQRHAADFAHARTADRFGGICHAALSAAHIHGLARNGANENHGSQNRTCRGD